MKGGKLLKSCQYCGKIHDSKILCKQKEIAIKMRQGSRKNKEVYSFHKSRKWTKKSLDIRKRDNWCCQVCIRGLYNPARKFETENISVHHIESVEKDWDRRFDDYNLITLCSKHHEMAEKNEISKKELKKIVEEQEEGPPGKLIDIF